MAGRHWMAAGNVTKDIVRELHIYLLLSICGECCGSGLRAGVVSRTGHRCHRLRGAHSQHSSPALAAALKAAHARKLTL